MKNHLLRNKENEQTKPRRSWWILMQQQFSNVYKHDTPSYPQGSRTTSLPYRLVCTAEGLNEMNDPK